MIRPLTLSLAALAVAAPAALADVPRVATDIAPVHSLVARVMGDLGTPDLIVRPGASPHGYSMRPSEARALASADLVVWTGEALTPWLSGSVETLAGEARVLGLLGAPGSVTLPSRHGAGFKLDAAGEDHDHDHADGEDHDHDHDHAEGGDHDHDHDHAEGGEHDHDHDHTEGGDHDHDHDHAEGEDHDHDHADAEGDGHDHDHADAAGHDHDHAHGPTDSHAWLDPLNAAVWMTRIAEVLGEMDPENAETYSANASAGVEELDTLYDDLSAQLQPVQDRRYIVFHDAYQYFENRFDLSAAGAMSLSDASDPSAARLAAIQDIVESNDIACVFAEPQFDRGVIDAVFEGTEARVAVLDPLGTGIETGAGLYPALLRDLGTALADCLSAE